MKKAIIIVLGLVFAFGFMACSAGEEEEAVLYDLIPMVMIDGELYLDTGFTGTYYSDDLSTDGEITSAVGGSEKPKENNQSNFGAGFGYRYGETEGTVELLMEHTWRIFATEEVRQQMQFPEK